ncbi:MAG: hypothetical protein AAGE94_15160 [Acidobacteriota bacterium]
MQGAFTDFVRSLDADGAVPDAEDFDRLWEALATTLTREIRRRGLWALPPAYLGLTGHTAWNRAAVDELVAPCYEHTFVDRLGGLIAQLAVKDTIDGLVVLHVRNFVHEAQKRHDPLGFRVYNVLRTAIERAIEAGDARDLSGSRRLRNDTILALGDPPADATEADAIDPATVADIVRRWNDLLLPDLVTAQGKAQASVVAHLGRLLADLPVAGIGVVRFGDVVEPLKADARRRWAELLDQDFGDTAFDDGEDGLPRLVRRLEPDPGWAEQHDFDHLVECVTEAVDHRGEPVPARYLSTLWQFLRSWSSGEHAVEDAELPSRRRLAGLLKIPRDRLGSLFATLAEMVEACRSATDGNGAVIPFGPRRDASRPPRTPG